MKAEIKKDGLVWITAETPAEAIALKVVLMDWLDKVEYPKRSPFCVDYSAIEDDAPTWPTRRAAK